MNIEDIDEIKKLIHELINAYSKNDAQRYVSRLEFIKSINKYNISPYSFEKLSQAINYAKQASGQVKNKEHWANNSEQSFYLFEREVRRDT